MTDDQRFERVIGAPAEVVFQAFTSPGGQQAFYGQDDPGWIVESECDLRVGGVWSVAFGPAPDRLYRHEHLIQIIEIPRRLLLLTREFRVDGSSLEFTTEFLFGDDDGRTLMTMIQTGFSSEERRDEHARGVPTAFDQFERFLQPPDPSTPTDGSTGSAPRR